MDLARRFLGVGVLDPGKDAFVGRVQYPYSTGRKVSQETLYMKTCGPVFYFHGFGSADSPYAGRGVLGRKRAGDCLRVVSREVAAQWAGVHRFNIPSIYLEEAV